MNSREYMREWRARHGANTGKVGRPITSPCGTLAAYGRHKRNGEAPCGPCALVWAEYHRDFRRRRKGLT